MLGHIAIAALGGCYSQNPDTGALEATYFPAQSIVIAGSFRSSVSRAPGTTNFNQGFTATEYWIREQILNWDTTSYANFLTLGTSTYSSQYIRAWVQCGMEPPQYVSHFWNGSTTRLSTTINPTEIWTCSKEAGSDITVMTNGSTKSRQKILDKPQAITQSPFIFSSGSATRSARFWGDLMHNPIYHIYRRRLPMECAEHPAVALYDADAQQLVEY